MIAMLDKAVLRGATFMPYMHRITPEGGSINIAEAAFARLIDRARYWMDLGKLQNKTYGQWWSAFRYATL
jgi:hypothetical protein